MVITSWEIAQLIMRILHYVGVASVVGGLFSFYLLNQCAFLHRVIKKYIVIGTLLGGGASLAYFLVLVGGVMESIASIFDADMLAIFWYSAAGDILVLNLFGYGLILLSMTIIGFKNSGEISYLTYSGLILALLGGASILYSFNLTGHSVEQGGFYKLVFSIHIFIAAWWLGQLFPLWLVAKHTDYQTSYRILDEFGKWASVGVAVLILCGLWMSYVLTGWQVIWSSDYLAWLLIKVALVVMILALAGYHKVYLVPAILTFHSARTIQRSILVEKFLAALILLVTAYLTSFLGPPIH